LVPPRRRQAYSVSLVLPAFNEGKWVGETIGSVQNAMDGLGMDYEIIIVDDGSTDETSSRALAAANGHTVRVVGYPGNMGKGFALMYGYERAMGDRVVFLDSDAEVSCRTLGRYLAALDAADLVIGSKRLPGSSVSAPFSRKFLSCGFHLLTSVLIGLKNTDTQSGLKAFRAAPMRRVFGHLAVKRYAFDVELLAVAQLQGLKVVELPVEVNISSQFNLKPAMHMFLDLLGIAYRLKIARSYQRRIGGFDAYGALLPSRRLDSSPQGAASLTRSEGHGFIQGSSSA
jgi:glycosyltransferase involved in cell wall biosynthesis